MNTSTASASSASSRITSMNRLLAFAAIVGTLAGCASTRLPPADEVPGGASPVPRLTVQGDGITTPRSRWVPVAWSDLPGFGDDNTYEAWDAWVKGCERPPPNWARLCGEVRQLSIASGDEQRAWLAQRLQPYRVESLQGAGDGLLT